MHDLDNYSEFKKLDPQNMIGEIDGLPDQLRSAWELGQTMPLPEAKNVHRVVIAGMGGSAIGADLVAAAVLQTCLAPIFVHRDYGLPAFAKGEETLAVLSSHSGNTEETLDSFEQAVKNHCTIVVISTGGEISKRAGEKQIPVWSFRHKGQPRAAVGFSFGLLLALLARLKLIPDPNQDLQEAIAAMKRAQEHLRAEVPAAHNPAKRNAGQLMGRWVTVFGAGALAPVARRFKGQMNEVAKAGANFEFLPEADHNTLAGTIHPEEVMMPHTMALFLRASSDHPRNRLRIDLTKQAFMLEGINTGLIEARGDSLLAQIWTLILFGDYMTYYLAMAYGIDPTPIPTLDNFKAEMKAA
ncbi:MAG TPA: bifunctional phosphoglucose/phosphomannose isomerase [Anaerolineales bacterium]|nr:bifunctional phosphoglucose/phosphomannose isomerase [Anaerolineales bacterium]